MMGSGEILVILVVILILFGGKKLPEFARSLGKGIREFKRACNGEDEVSSTSTSVETVHKESSHPSLPSDSSNDRS
jgi:sec-independent protein translocase protein TatA